MKLTDIQKIAVEATGKNVLVSAGAGTGKTRVLVERFLHLVTSGQALVTEILALTFTEKAANEMKSRILDGLKKLGMEGARRELEFGYISTIHAFASRILKEHPLEAGVAPDFQVIEDEEADLIQEQALDEILESACENSPEAFELLRIYTEKNVRKGILEIFNAARIEGKTAAEFFLQSRRNREAQPWHGSQNEMRRHVAGLFEKLKEKKLAAEWRAFSETQDWDWKKLDALKEWFKNFAKHGGKNGKETWKEIKQLVLDFRASRLDLLAGAWRPSLEKLVSDFESLYEARKKEKACLDFDDLQSKVLAVLEKDHPASRKLLAHYRRLFKFIMVDESQDTNPLQMRFIETLASNQNLFLVGDFKQSIYGFRGVSPEHFAEREKKYGQNQEGVRIPLLESFRANESVLNFINLFFKNLWLEDGFEFEDLICKECPSPQPSPPVGGGGDKVNKFPLSSLGRGQGEGNVELLITELKEDEDMDHARIREASEIASRILQLHENGTPFKDIAVLFQAMSGSGIYEQALKRAGIPYFIAGGRGFYHQPEIRDMMSFLACLENPLSDIALAATLRSPFFCISDDTLFWLAHHAKQNDETAPLFQAVKNFEDISQIHEEQKNKLRIFKTVLDELLEEKDKMRLAELVGAILVKTSFELSVLADPQGVRRYANLKKLMDLAREYESRDKMTLGDFIRTIRHIENRDVRESEAPLDTEQSGDVVRLMTIHKAKGLEFSVCFVADLAHQRQHAESKLILAESGFGAAFQIYNQNSWEPEKPLFWRRIDEKIKKRENEEWKRLCYVAFTRAKSRLILSGVWKEKKNPKEAFNEMSSWMDWILSLEETLDPLLEVVPDESDVFRRQGLPLADQKDFRGLFENWKPQPVEMLFPDTTERDRLAGEGRVILENLKSHKKSVSRAIDLPVSAYSVFSQDPQRYWRVYEIGIRGEVKKSELFLEPADLDQEDETSTADFGTSVHWILERLNFKRPEDHLNSHLESVFGRNNSEEMAQARQLLHAFIQSPVFHRLQKAKQLHREVPFVLNQRHGRINGVIDLLFQEDSGAWHVLDYKTAVGDSDKIIKAGYDLQIAVYAIAVQQILKTLPASGIIYFLKNQWSQTLALNAKVLAEYESRLQNMQGEILLYSSSDRPAIKSSAGFATGSSANPPKT